MMNPRAIITLASVFTASALAAWDDSPPQYPLKNICRRWDHQTAVLNDKLYLVGGHVLLLDHLKKNNSIGFRGEPSGEFLELDLTKSFNLVKDLPSSGLDVPWQPVAYDSGDDSINLALASGGMWTGGDKLYLYDGQHTRDGAASDPSSLLSYDTVTTALKAEDTWFQDNNPIPPHRYSRGTAVDLPQLGLGIYVGGARLWQSENGKNKSWVYPLEDQMMTMQLGQGDFDREFTSLGKRRKTLGAAVTWLPVGEKGILVMIGGTREENERSWSPVNGKNAADELPPSTAMNPKEEVWIYDIAAKKWHIQDTSGSIPHERMGACAVGVSEPDKKTHQIFYYGGSSGSSMFGLDDLSTYGDLYVLSLPTFTWTKFDELASPPNKRTRHTCHLINSRQLLLVGGSRNDSASTDTGLREHCVWDEISVLDMSALRWESEYRPATDGYTVPTLVAMNTLDNGRQGTAPRVGWANDDLRILFEGKEKGPGPVGAHGGVTKATIIGASVGGACGLILLLAGVGIFFWRRKKAMVTEEERWRQSTMSHPPSYWDDRTKSYLPSPKTEGFGSPLNMQGPIQEIGGTPVIHELHSPDLRGQ